MIEATTSQTPPNSGAIAAAASSAAPGGFALALGAYLDATALPAGSSSPAVSERQGDADSGKTVPQNADDPSDEDRNDTGAIWLPLAAPPILVVAAGPSSTAATSAAPFDPMSVAGERPPQLRAGIAAEPITQAVDTIDGTTPVSANPVVTASFADPRATEAPRVAATTGAVVEMLAAAPAKPDSPNPSSHDSDPALALTTTTAVTPTALRGDSRVLNPIQPARQAFAAALTALSIAPRRTRLLDDDAVSTTPIATDLNRPVALSIVHAAGDTGATALDLRQDRGIEQMIDHIEALRDGADSQDTRIRLVPDALGTVDIAVRRQGDAVHVHFAADSDATRAAIADAQPRLAQLAETRGVRIAGTSIDSGTGGGNAQPQPRPEFSRPAPTATRTSAAEVDSTTDQRLA